MRRIVTASALVVSGLLVGFMDGPVSASTSTTVTWKVSSLTAGQVKSLSAIASSNSPGVKTWSKTGSCTLTPKSKPTKLTMGLKDSCVLTLKIAKSGKYPAKMSGRTINQALGCATGGPCALGDTGPGGGLIFYVDLARAAGSKYFEAACFGWQNGCNGKTADPKPSWGCSGTLIFGANGTAIGTGEQNTADILAGCDYSDIAAKVAGDLVLGGQTDWFLPSKDELNQMYIQQTETGGFGSQVYYWSSSEDQANYAWAKCFCNHAGDATFLNGEKFANASVRPIRSF